MLGNQESAVAGGHESQPATNRASFQFTVRSLLVLMTSVAVVCSGLFAPEAWICYLTVMLLAGVLPMTLTVALIYGQGYVRTFSIGGLFPAGIAFFWFDVVNIIEGPPFFFESRAPTADVRANIAVGMMAALAVTAVAGLLAMGVRWVVESGQRR